MKKPNVDTPETNAVWNKYGTSWMSIEELVEHSRSLERQRDEALAQLSKEKKLRENACMDWAEDHTHLQKLCWEAGCFEHEVFGTSCGVPGIQDLADLLVSKLKITQNDCQ